MGDDLDFETLLAKTATNAERIQALVALGLRPQLIAEATKSSESAVRNWKAGSANPKADAAIVIDDLRLTALTLLRGVAPERVAPWFTSRDPDYFDGARPIEMIAIDPMEVLAAAHATALERTPALA